MKENVKEEEEEEMEANLETRLECKGRSSMGGGRRGGIARKGGFN